MDEQKKYKLRYNIDFKKGNFTKEELGDSGGTDALVLFSILRHNDSGAPHEGAKSIAFISIDGREDVDEIPTSEVFQIFAHLSGFLSKQSSGWQQQIAKTTFDMVKQIVTLNTERNKK